MHNIFLIFDSTYSPGKCLGFYVQRCHGVIEPDPFHVKYHSIIIPCDQGYLAVYTSLWYPSKPVGYNEGL